MKILIDTHILLWASAEPARKDMPFHHKDPFDRLIIAQSIVNNYPVMTNDPKFRLYQCPLF